MKNKIKISFLDHIAYLILIVLSFSLSFSFFYSLFNLKNLNLIDFFIIFLSIIMYFSSKLKEDQSFNFYNFYKNLSLNKIENLFPEIIRLGSSYGFSISLFYFLSIFFPKSNFFSSFVIKEFGSLLQNNFIDLILEILIVLPLVLILLIIIIFLSFIIALILYLPISFFSSNSPTSHFQKVKEIFSNKFLKNKDKNLNFTDDLIVFVSLIISLFILFSFSDFVFLKLNFDPQKSLIENLKYLLEKVGIKNLISFLLPIPLYLFFKILFDEKIKKGLGLKNKN
mgnify:CR=1 FL=1